MASTDGYRGTIAIHIHSEATNINAAGIVYGGVGHRTENGIIKEVSSRVDSLQGTRCLTTGDPSSAQGIRNETRSQVRTSEGVGTSSQEKSAQSTESETSSHVKTTQDISKETSSEAGCAHDAVQTSRVESGQNIEIKVETAKIRSAEEGRQEPPAGEETALPLRNEAAVREETGLPLGTAAGGGCEHFTVYAKAGEELAGHGASTNGCRKEHRGAKGYQQVPALESPVPGKEGSESCQTEQKPRQLSRGMKNSDRRQEDNDFHRACRLGDLDRVVRILSEDQENLNRTDSNGRTGLMVAAYQGHRNVVELLVTKDADLTLVDKGGDSVLHAACRSGDINIVKCILSRDELDVNSSDKSGMTPAMSAARWGYGDVVKLLLRRGAKMQLVDDEGDTILHYACRGGNEDVVECIVSAETALVNVKNRKGETAAKVAKEQGHYVVCECLKSGQSGCYLM